MESRLGAQRSSWPCQDVREDSGQAEAGFANPRERHDGFNEQFAAREARFRSLEHGLAGWGRVGPRSVEDTRPARAVRGLVRKCYPVARSSSMHDGSLFCRRSNG